VSCATCPAITRPVKSQSELWDEDLFRAPRIELPSLLDYDYYLVAFSGGKDSIACFLALLEMGVPRDKIELMHQEVDGREEGRNFMDWPCTCAYVRAFAAAFGVQIYFSWREGGFKREMLRNNTPTAQTHFETPEGLRNAGGKSGKLGTRRMFPQVSADLSVRWCSSYLKIDVASIAIQNQPRFHNSRTLAISGERAQESSARAKYKVFEIDRTDARDGSLKRHVDRCRLVHQWNEAEIWDIIARWRVNPHPAYRLGWGRLSCSCCLFGNSNQWASAKVVLPDYVQVIAGYEKEFGKTIDRDMSVLVKASLGKAYPECSNAKLVAEARDEKWNGRIILNEGEWQLPAGAFGESNGPT
jgi:3'-phosphoadenosine 5'-phosphosulfate sulfotransferase (PAPS reductase)/FAD synthetase